MQLFVQRCVNDRNTYRIGGFRILDDNKPFEYIANVCHDYELPQNEIAIHGQRTVGWNESARTWECVLEVRESPADRHLKLTQI